MANELNNSHSLAAEQFCKPRVHWKGTMKLKLQSHCLIPSFIYYFREMQKGECQIVAAIVVLSKINLLKETDSLLTSQKAND